MQTKIDAIRAAFEHKPNELEHLYLDTNEDIRDRHIEDMFKQLFNGEPLDDIFIHNFTLYFDALAVDRLPRYMSPGPEVFTDPDIARAWVTYNFGLLYVGALKPGDPVLTNDTFSHCTHEARLRSHALAPTAVHYCYGPGELNATLLAVVNLFREVASEYHKEVLARSA